MPPAARLRVGAAATLLAVVGVVVVHTLETVRVLGTDAAGAALGRPLHAYMPLLAGSLVLAGAGAALYLHALWRALARRLDATGAAVRALLTGARAGAVAPAGTPALPGRPPSAASSLAVLATALGAAQVLLYVVQENLEYRAAGLPLPGLAVVTGVHAPVLAIHAAVALILAVGALLVVRLLGRRLAALAVVAGILTRLLARLARAGVAPLVPASIPPARRRLAHALWGRPPPSSARLA